MSEISQSGNDWLRKINPSPMFIDVMGSKPAANYEGVGIGDTNMTHSPFIRMRSDSDTFLIF